ncbi:transposase [Novosphingobium sp. ES2-1]|uniref:transposase n=1 Tax=Novosphingobium TaxID=165696 RepID=UPI0012E09324|nr:transposase [Novosphingobium sp. ES2-1]
MTRRAGIDPRLLFGGRPPEQNRSIVNGVRWRLRCGAPWREVPPKHGSWNTYAGSGDK